MSSLLQAEESQKKRRTHEGNDKGDILTVTYLNVKCCKKNRLNSHQQTLTSLFSTLKALRPPVPPAFCAAFSNIVNLLCCDIIVHILRRVLQRAAEDRATHWTEAMIQRVHIIK